MLERPNNRSAHPLQAALSPIGAQLAGSNICIARSIRVDSVAPVLDLCRRLVAAGYDPATPLQCYRFATLCLRIRSIGEAAGFELSARGTGFVRYRIEHTVPVRPAPPMHSNGGAAR
jgi:hypothetical protein